MGSALYIEGSTVMASIMWRTNRNCSWGKWKLECTESRLYIISTTVYLPFHNILFLQMFQRIQQFRDDHIVVIFLMAVCRLQG